MKILFCNIGWMESYRGLTAADQIVGGGSYVKEKGIGHEVCNFNEHRGVCYGYVQPPRSKARFDLGQINIDRINGKGMDSVGGVLVIWTARRPEGDTVVVGWYKDATVHRFFQKFKGPSICHKKNKLRGYRIEAKKSDVTLLPIDERTCTIPRKIKGGMGQSNIWFADTPQSQPTRSIFPDFVSRNSTFSPFLKMMPACASAVSIRTGGS